MRCLRRMLRICYCYTLGCGMVPGCFQRLRFQPPSPRYLGYTVCLQALLLLQLPFTLPKFMDDSSYMSNNATLLMSFKLTSLTRVCCMLVYTLVVWTKRRVLLQLSRDYLAHFHACEQLEAGATQPSLSSFRRRARRVSLQLTQQLIMLHTHVIASGILLLRLEQQYSAHYYFMVLVHMVQFIYVLIAMLGVYVPFLLLNWQRQRINVALQQLFVDMQQQLSHATRPTARLQHLMALHCASYRLMARLLSIFDVPTGFMLLRMFVTNVYVVYHGLQFDDLTLKSTSWVIVCGQLTIVCHYWGAVLLMNVVDDLGSNYNETGHIVGQFSALQGLRPPFQLELERFADHLRCHKPVYKVCGLFVFNKQACLAYFFTVVSKVIVLMQLQMQNKVQKA